MTNYSLAVRNIRNFNEYERLSESLEEFDLYKYVFDIGAYYKKEKEAIFLSWEPQEWSSYNGQMIILSEKYPWMMFELTCQQEDTFWRTYYKDGETETCYGEVIFERPRKIKWEAMLTF